MKGEQKIKRIFVEQPSLKLRQTAAQALISIITFWLYYTYDLKDKFYHTTSVQRLQEPYKAHRCFFSQWLLDHDEDFVDRII